MIEIKQPLSCGCLEVHKCDFVAFKLNDVDFYSILFVIILLIKHKKTKTQEIIITLPVRNYYYF